MSLRVKLDCTFLFLVELLSRERNFGHTHTLSWCRYGRFIVPTPLLSLWSKVERGGPFSQTIAPSPIITPPDPPTLEPPTALLTIHKTINFYECFGYNCQNH